GNDAGESTRGGPPGRGLLRGRALLRRRLLRRWQLRTDTSEGDTLSDALAESQAKNTANSLRRLEMEVSSKRILMEEGSRRIVPTPSRELRKGDLILLEKSDTVPIDAQVLEGIAMVDESLLTGESTAVRKAPGDDVIGGSQVLSDTLTAKVTVNPDENFIN